MQGSIWQERVESLEQAVKAFEALYMPSRNFSARTRIEYKNDLTQLVDFLKTCGISKVRDVGLAHLQSFLVDLDTRGLAGVTRRRKVAVIRALFGFLTKSAFIPRNPTEQLIPPEREFKEPRYLSRQEYEALVAAASQNLRDRAVIELFLQTGMKLSEVARLTLHDIELPTHVSRSSELGRVFIQGRRRKERSLLLNYKACQALKAWLSVRSGVVSPALFVTRLGEPLSKRGIQRMVSEYFKKTGIQNANVTSLRHTFGVHHAFKGTDLRIIQAQMGLQDIRDVEIYGILAKEVAGRALQDHAL